MKNILLSILLSLGAGYVQAQPWAGQVKDIRPSNLASNPHYFYPYNNKVFFAADDGPNGNEVWTSDGSEAGTQLLKDIFPGSFTWPQAHGANPMFFKEVNGKLYFAGQSDTTFKHRLWVTDGTEIGTKQIADVNITAPLTPFGNKFLFVNDSDTYRQPWISDGTPGGTHMLKKINTSPNRDYHVGQFKVLNNIVCFGGLGKLWITDGTETGTQLLKDIDIAWYDEYEYNGIEVNLFTAYNNKLYFPATTPQHGTELWETDGTESGTKLVYDIKPGSDGASVRFLTAVGSEIFFFANTSDTLLELWKTDGTTSGTVKIHDTLPNNLIYITPPVAVGSKLYFVDDNKLWVSDGTHGGTFTLVDNVNLIRGTIAFNNKLYFFVHSGSTNYALYRTDGTKAGTEVVLQDLVANTNQFVTAVGNSLYFNGASTGNWSNDELWRLTDFPTGVTEIKKVITTTIYPNPATTTFSIKTENLDTTTVKLYSITGQLMLQTKETNNINIARLPAGIYTVHITTGGKTTVEKLVKE